MAHLEVSEISVGQLIKLHNAYCGVVMDKFISPDGNVILRVQTLRNVWRGFKSELIDTTVAPQGVYPATVADVRAEVAQHQEVINAGLASMLGMAGISSAGWLKD